MQPPGGGNRRSYRRSRGQDRAATGYGVDLQGRKSYKMQAMHVKYVPPRCTPGAISPGDQNGFTITRMTIAIISRVGISFAMR